MKVTSVSRRGALNRRVRSITALLLSILFLQTLGAFVLTTHASQRPPNKTGKMTGDQRIAHVLSRLTYGARPGDFERVKAMGVEAFINQQLDPDSIDNAAVIAKLRRLPTLGMATPLIIEQYTPPKPVASPSPLPAKSPDEQAAPPKSIAEIGEKQDAGKMPGLQSTMQNEMQAD